MEDRLNELQNELELGVKEMYESEHFKRYLDFFTSFHNYSYNNIILIARQNRNATMVSGFVDWQKRERFVKKGEKGIKILRPKISNYIIHENQKIPFSKATNEQKELLKTGAAKQHQFITGFDIATVFDISQTDGKPIPTLANTLSGSDMESELVLKALKQIIPIPIKHEDMAEQRKGYYNFKDQFIALNSKNSNLQNLKTLIHEYAHYLLHDPKKRVVLNPIVEYDIDFLKADWKKQGIDFEIKDIKALYTESGGMVYVCQTEKAEKDREVVVSGNKIPIMTTQKPLKEFISYLAVGSQKAEEVEAESIAYIVSKYMGLDTSDYSFGYVAAWANSTDLDQLKTSAEMIKKTSRKVIEQLEEHKQLFKQTEYVQTTSEGLQPVDYTPKDQETVNIDKLTISGLKSMIKTLEKMDYKHEWQYEFTRQEIKNLNEKIEIKTKELIYTPLDKSQTIEAFEKNIDHLYKLDQKARDEGSIIGRFIREPAADSYAYYQVVSESAKNYTIKSVKGIGDDWEISIFGSKATVNKEKIEEIITQRDNFDDFLKKRQQEKTL